MAYNIAVDAMGGDNAPHEIIKGTAMALRENDELNVILIGDEEQIKAELDKEGLDKEVPIIHTDEWIGMDESPKQALTEKKNASIALASQLLKSGEADALVSAGNTGATVLAAAQNIPIIEGIERTALAAIYPTAKFNPESHGIALMLDVGATLRCTSKQLVHFAYMGSFYVSHVLQFDKPRVALLNNGEEPNKGGEILVKTHQELKEAEDINFIGNVEGKDILKGVAEVIVTEGFVGNIVLKLIEGAADVLRATGRYAFKKKFTWKLGLALLSSGVKRFKSKTDYTEYGGAPLLGFQKLAIKAHGRSNAKAIYNAIKVAQRSIEVKVCDHISDSIQNFNAKHRIDFIDI
ncbi:MAG: phosphate acyltransferase PlsX [Calditrichaceae bacterium]|nr:phosphate acyltransferase PlsX [Calditrichaceae bacterium]